MVAAYMVLFLVRPWEILLPQLQALRFERVFAIAMIGVVLLTRRSTRWASQSSAVIAVFLAAILSAYRAWQGELAWPQVYQYATVVITYFLMRSVCRNWSDLMWLVLTYVGTMHLYLTKSLWEYFVHNRHVYAQGVSRLTGIEVTYGEPNAVAMSAVVTLPLWLCLWRTRHGLSWAWQSTLRKAFGIGLITFPAAVFLAVGLTNSRAGMAALAAFIGGAMWLGVEQRKPIRLAVLACILIVGLFVVAPEAQRNRLRTLWNPDIGPANARESAGGRWQGLLAALDMVQARPLSGVGLGNFVAYRVSYLDGVGLLAHNLPGQLLGEMGWVGAVCFAWFLLVLWRNSRRLQQSTAGVFELRHFWQFAMMSQLTILLLLFFGLSLHNALRYNWLWLAAFVTLASEFAADELQQFDEDVMLPEDTSFRMHDVLAIYT